MGGSAIGRAILEPFEIEAGENDVVGKLAVGTFALAVEQSDGAVREDDQVRIEARSLVDDLVPGPCLPSSVLRLTVIRARCWGSAGRLNRRMLCPFCALVA